VNGVSELGTRRVCEMQQLIVWFLAESMFRSLERRRDCAYKIRILEVNTQFANAHMRYDVVDCIRFQRSEVTGVEIIF